MQRTEVLMKELQISVNQVETSVKDGSKDELFISLAQLAACARRVVASREQHSVQTLSSFVAKSMQFERDLRLYQERLERKLSERKMQP